MSKGALTFDLQKGERIVLRADRCLYQGSELSPKNLTKNTITIADSKLVHIYLTNKRIVFCNVKNSIFSGEEHDVGLPFSEMDLNIIKRLNKSSKLGCAAIDISIDKKGMVDEIKIWFKGTSSGRENERDRLLSSVKSQIAA